MSQMVEVEKDIAVFSTKLSLVTDEATFTRNGFIILELYMFGQWKIRMLLQSFNVLDSLLLTTRQDQVHIILDFCNIICRCLL